MYSLIPHKIIDKDVRKSNDESILRHVCVYVCVFKRVSVCVCLCMYV